MITNENKADDSASLTPSAILIKDAQTEIVVTDSLGRAIRLRKPNALAQYRLIEVLGDSAKNERYTNMVSPLIFVRAIDGEEVRLPKNKGEVDALIQRLDDEGITAVVQGILEHYIKTDEQTEKLAIKKS